MLDTDEPAAWSTVPKISAEGPHQLQSTVGLYRPASDALPMIDWSVPVFKLTHRVDEELFESGCLLDHLLHSVPPNAEQEAVDSPTPPGSASLPLASLKVSTQNLGVHIQITAGLNMLRRFGATPALFLDRDNEIHTAHALDDRPGAVGMLLNGWFKTNGTEWPPHPSIRPIFLGFHIRLFQCPELVSAKVIEYYRSHEPIYWTEQYLLYAYMLDNPKIKIKFGSSYAKAFLPKDLEKLMAGKCMGGGGSIWYELNGSLPTK